MDGLLIDSEKIYFLSARACSADYHYGLTDELILSTMGLNLTATYQRFSDVLGIDFPMEDFLKHERVYHKKFLDDLGLQKKKGVDELFAYLDQNGIKKAIATSTYKKRAEMFLQMANIPGPIDHMTCGDELKESKPEPEIYLKAASAFPFDKDEILAFEDSPNGILSAYNAGLKVVHIPDLAYVSEEIKEKSFIVLDDLSQAIKLIEDLNS